jgi:hypothetical protein
MCKVVSFTRNGITLTATWDRTYNLWYVSGKADFTVEWLTDDELEGILRNT